MSGIPTRWYEDAVIYAIDVERFQDADDDGVGDFVGLTRRLDYLERLDVDCLWLLPFYPSPNRDNGYDVMDYYGVDPRHGTLGDFVEFLEAAEDRGIRVLVDLVVNHTSDQHPWFQRAREDPDSEYRDYYVWSTDPQISDDPRQPAFPGEGEGDSVWTYDSQAGAYYYHRFYSFQPDLDLANPQVREEIRKIMAFWLQLGVSGFRVDAAGLMTEQKRPGLPPLDDRHEFLRKLRSFVVPHGDDIVLLAEADDDPEELVSYVEGGDKMDLLLNFVLDAYLIDALATERGTPLAKCIEELPDLPARGAWANFLRNYDELNVSRLPTEDRQLVFDRFAPEEDMRIYGRGIRRRLAPMLDGDRRRIELAFSLLFSMPGATVIVFGDEIGMGEDLSLPGREAVRTPMQWSATANAGFSSAPSARLVRPIVSEGPFSFENVNVTDQWAEDGSLLNQIHRLIELRQELPTLGWGNLVVMHSEPDTTFTHRFDGDEVTIGMAHNLSGDACSVTVEIPEDAGTVSELFGDGEVRRLQGSRCGIDLDGFGYQWLRVDRT